MKNKDSKLDAFIIIALILIGLFSIGAMNLITLIFCVAIILIWHFLHNYLSAFKIIWSNYMVNRMYYLYHEKKFTAEICGEKIHGKIRAEDNGLYLCHSCDIDSDLIFKVVDMRDNLGYKYEWFIGRKRKRDLKDSSVTNLKINKNEK